MFDVLPLDETITIRAETSVADPDTCKFTVSRTVHRSEEHTSELQSL